jgi:phenylpropionate dioxygenase-like ring-hydroxylating dioxygenase large terminal subunit
MVETLTGTDRSGGVTYDEVLARDSHPVKDILRADNPMPPGPTTVDPKVYYSREVFEQEKEKLWKRVWQMACHEDDIPSVGDAMVYNIADLSYIVVRSAQDEFHAFPNACLHRGRQLLHQNEQGLPNFRCAFHGWSWTLNGELNEVPCHWDFPTVSKATHSLKQIKVGRWGGFVFINPDPNCEPLADYLGNLDEHFTAVPMDRRYKAVHVAKRLSCNWKVAQEAFSEAYHSIATHPTLLGSLGCANSKYDIFGNFSRALSASQVGSPHVPQELADNPYMDATPFTRQRHELTGHIYERVEEGRVKITTTDNRVGYFDDRGNHLDGAKFHADIHLCNWVGGRLVEGMDELPSSAARAGDFAERRATAAAERRESLRETLGDMMDEVSDAELLDPMYYSVFPNISPWGSFNPIFYRFRPYGDNPEECIHECLHMLPVPAGEPRPPAAKMRWLDLDDDYIEAPELGSLAKVFNQDTLNLPYVQKGLHSLDQVIFANYGETKPRHFHKLYNEWMAKD